MKRILLFLATNLAVMVVLSVVVHLLGVDRYLTAQGIDYESLASFTNFGGVDVMAPGVNITSTLPAGACGARGWICLNGPYANASGSSFATPIVAGAVALLRAEFPTASAEQHHVHREECEQRAERDTQHGVDAAHAWQALDVRRHTGRERAAHDTQHADERDASADADDRRDAIAPERGALCEHERERAEHRE